MDDALFLFLHLTVVFVFFLLMYLLRIREKKQIHYVFMVNIFLALVWSLGCLLEAYYRNATGKTEMAFVFLWNIGLCFMPLSLLFTGMIFANTKIRVSYKTIFLVLPPLLSYVMLLTNDFHHLYFIRFSIRNEDVIQGPYFYIHSLISYSYIFIGLFYLMRFSIKNSGFFSKQSLLVSGGSLIPVMTNILITFKIIKVPLYTTAISFSIAIILYALAIFRYSFLKVAPIALQTIVDMISDGFIILNEDNLIIDFNETTQKTFRSTLIICRNISFEIFIKKAGLTGDDRDLLELINEARINDTTVSCKKSIQKDPCTKYFSIEITPITAKKNFLGTIILFKDITENIRYIETIEEKHAIMMEQERLASLGQLIGGIAHNLKTPIMSIAGAVEGLKDLVSEYDQSIEDAGVTAEDHHEIAAEMRSWLDKIKPYCAYMTDIIDTVKGQAMKFNVTTMMSFTVNELVKRIELLMKYELIRYKCQLNTTIDVNYNTELYGDINSLVQVFDNIIINAIQAYKKKNGQIDFMVSENQEGVLFSLRDYAKGIPESIKHKLLKEMVTTKGKDGTGLGLYMSHSTIKGRFGGKMWFESEEGKGTTFYILIPRRK